MTKRRENIFTFLEVEMFGSFLRVTPQIKCDLDKSKLRVISKLRFDLLIIERKNIFDTKMQWQLSCKYINSNIFNKSLPLFSHPIDY